MRLFSSVGNEHFARTVDFENNFCITPIAVSCPSYIGDFGFGSKISSCIPLQKYHAIWLLVWKSIFCWHRGWTPGCWSPPASVAPWIPMTIARWCRTLDAGERDPPLSSAARSRRSPMSLPSSHAVGAVVKTRAFDLEHFFLHAVQGPVAQTPPRVVFFENVRMVVRLLLRSDGVANDIGNGFRFHRLHQTRTSWTRWPYSSSPFGYTVDVFEFDMLLPTLDAVVLTLQLPRLHLWCRHAKPGTSHRRCRPSHHGRGQRRSVTGAVAGCRGRNVEALLSEFATLLVKTRAIVVIGRNVRGRAADAFSRFRGKSRWRHWPRLTEGWRQFPGSAAKFVKGTFFRQWHLFDR